MRFDHILISFLIISLFVIGGTMMINDMDTKYEDENLNLSDDKFAGVYDKVDEVYGITDDAKDKTLEGDISETDSWESMTKGSYSAVRLVGGTAPMFMNITSVVAQEVGVPPFLVKISYVAFIISIIFGVVYMIFRYEPQK
jgi:hypothetical protein